MKRQRRAALAAALAAAVAVGTPAAFGSGSGGAAPRPVVQGLDGPRGIDTGFGGLLVFAEADGTVSQTWTYGRKAGKVEKLAEVPPSFVAPAVDRNNHGTVFILTVGGEPGSGAATLYRLRSGAATPRVMADIGAYQQKDPDPDDLEGEPTTSNPFGVAALRGGAVLVSDAEGNDLLRVGRTGKITTVARIKPRTVQVPEGYPPPPDFPPAGTRMPSEGVATSVTVGADGYYYLGELRGFPATPGKSQVWRIKPGTKDAVCNPRRPNRGPCKRFADGFTSIVDLGAGRDGSIYVTELAKAGWLAAELGLADPPLGSVKRIPAGGGRPTELARNQLILPGGVAINQHGRVFATAPTLGEGSILRLN